jgi:hypothetical protein
LLEEAKFLQLPYGNLKEVFFHTYYLPPYLTQITGRDAWRLLSPQGALGLSGRSLKVQKLHLLAPYFPWEALMSPTMREVTLVDPFWDREDFGKYLNTSSLISFAIHPSGFDPPDHWGFRTGTEILLRCLETLFSMRKKHLESLHLSCVHAGSFYEFTALKALSIPLKDLIGP